MAEKHAYPHRYPERRDERGASRSTGSGSRSRRRSRRCTWRSSDSTWRSTTVRGDGSFPSPRRTFWIRPESCGRDKRIRITPWGPPGRNHHGNRPVDREVPRFARFTIEYPGVRQPEKKFPHRGPRPRPPRGVGGAPSLVLREGRHPLFAGARRGRPGALSGHGPHPRHGGPGRARHHPAAGDAGPERRGEAAPRRARPADPADSRLSHRLLDHQAAYERLLPREHAVVQGGPPGGVPEGGVRTPSGSAR